MRTWMATATSLGCQFCKKSVSSVISSDCDGGHTGPGATSGETVGGEASLKLPDLSQVTFLGGIDGHKLLLVGLLFCVFGLAIWSRHLYAPEEPAGAPRHAARSRN